jgi:thiol:disulfide interchange protein
LAGTLVFLSQSRDVVLAGTALFAMAMGMSMPLLLLGASAGHWLPRSGAWMHAVKRFFGLLLVGVALWVAQPALPPSLALALWAGLLLVVGFMLRPFDAHPHSGAPRVWLQRAAGVAALAYGLMQLAGQPLVAAMHCSRCGTGAGRGFDIGGGAGSELPPRVFRGRTGPDPAHNRPPGDAGLLCRLVRGLQGNGALHLQ